MEVSDESNNYRFECKTAGDEWKLMFVTDPPPVTVKLASVNKFVKQFNFAAKLLQSCLAAPQRYSQQQEDLLNTYSLNFGVGDVETK